MLHVFAIFLNGLNFKCINRIPKIMVTVCYLRLYLSKLFLSSVTKADKDGDRLKLENNDVMTFHRIDL